MTTILQVILIAILTVSATFSSDLKYIKKITLKKDKQKKILVKYGSRKRLFKFRWTLYKNGGLVVFRSYDRIVGQNILNLSYQSQSFRVELKPRGEDAYHVPYILVKFKKFNFKKREALFELFLSDDKNQIKLEYLKK